MSQICIFCGKQPNSKNKEHVLPQWLLRMTGDPIRVVRFRMNYFEEKLIEFNWKNFTAPACRQCNDKYASFEAEIQPLIEKLTNKKEITGNEAIKILDWFDKVRVGLWLNYYYLEKNKGQISPKLCIDNRLGKKDRFLQIYFLESRHKSEGLNAFGVETFAFQFNPSFFGLRINNILIINGSNDFFISKNCGFPYPNFLEIVENGMLSVSDWKYDRQTSPIIDNLALHKAVLTIMQPIHTEMKYESNFFNDSYLFQNCIDLTNRIGTLFKIENNVLNPIKDLNSFMKYESVIGNETKLIGELIAKVYEGQNVFLSRIKSKKNEAFKKAIEINIKHVEYYKALSNNV